MKSTGERTKMFHQERQERCKPNMTQITNWTGRHWLLVDLGKNTKITYGIAIELAEQKLALSVRDTA